MMSSKSSTDLDFAADIDFSKILTNPILDIAARFWEEDRYEAFKVCYRSMRVIDDLVDDRKSAGKISSVEIENYTATINLWLDNLRSGRSDEPFLKQLLEIINKFQIPIWPWERLGKAMIFDLSHESFPSFLQYLRYTEGAAIAPASIFTHLCGITSERKPPAYDIRFAARHLAVFSYLVHIVRDFEKDQKSNLNYYADDILRKYSIKPEALKTVAEGGPVPESFRQVMAFYKKSAAYYQNKARLVLNQINRELSPRYRLSLEIIYVLYSQIFDRIDPKAGSFTAKELNPTSDELQALIKHTVANFKG